MNQDAQPHSSFVRWIKRAGWAILGLLLVFMVLRLSLKTRVVQAWTKNFIISTANKQLNATLSIHELSGDLWTQATLSGIRLAQEDTIANIDSVHAAYNVWALLGGRIEITQLGIYQPQTKLRQRSGRWNVQDIMSPSSDTTASGGGFSLQIDNLELTGGSVSVRSDSLPVESNFSVRNVNIASSLSYSADGFDVNLRDLSFQVDNTQLQNPLSVKTSASAQQNKVTLEKLVLATGNSMIRSSGFASAIDSSAQLDFSAHPVSWKDIASYARDFPLREDLQIDLALSGRPEQFGITVNMQSDGLQALQINSRFRWQNSLVLQKISARAEDINPQTLLSDTTLPSLQDFEAEFTGQVDILNYRESRGDLTFSAKNVARSPYHLDLISGRGSLADQSASLDLEARQQQQKVTTNVQVEQIWSDLPSITAHIEAANIDPAYWMQDTTYAGNLSFRTELGGRGWYPQKSPWKYSLAMSESRFMGQPINDFSAKGKLNDQDASLDARMRIREGMITMMARVRDMKQTPRYDYRLETRDIDLGPMLGIEDFKTVLNSKVTGKGQGISPASMQLNTVVSIDSSLVNNELVRNLSADLSIRDSIAVVDSASLQSTIAEGSFTMRMNMLRRYHADNELEFDLLLRDLEALAPLANVSDLEAEGTIEGSLKPTEDENLRFLGTVDLSDLKYNELFSADEAKGSVELQMQKTLMYLADLDLSSPKIYGVQLQDLSLMTKGGYADSRASGEYKFQFSSSNEGEIDQGGTYSLAGDSSSIRTTEFNIISDYRTLSLEKPFELRMQNNTLSMDTMRVSSKRDTAFLEIVLPRVNSHEQRGSIRGNALNTAVIQSSLFGQTYIKGMLSGQFHITRKDTSLDADGQLLLSEVQYEDTTFDSLLVTGQIQNERLEGKLTVRNEGRELITGDANLPFKLGNPETLPAEFFEEPVEGRIRVREIAIDRFRSLFAKAGLTETSGVFTFRGQLKGEAGQPEFEADASLKKAKLSGVAVDSVTAGFNYSHEKQEMQLDASVLSMKQKAAQINARFPLFINMKTFRVDLPQAKDSINVDVETNNFNLAAVNDFLDRRTLRGVSGQLDGMVHVMGAVGDLKTDGQLQLRKGAFRLVPAGIRVDNIQSALKFDPNQLRIAKFSARSGKGDIKASGMVKLEKLVPGALDIRVKAENFRAANTSQYNAIINLDARAQGQVTKPKLTGSLSFVSGFIELQNFGEKSVENVKLDSAETEPQTSIYDSLALDMDVSFNQRFFIRNKRYLEMEIELDGTLDLLKESGKDLQLFGTMNTPNGYARPFGKEFELQEGAIAFSGEPANPQLNIRTRYEPPQTQQEIVIWYVIEGTVEKPKFRYESQPPMGLENIIAYTLFGQPFYALDSWRQVVASSGGNTSAADVALDVLLDRVEALATQKLGIDVVKIDNTRNGGETGTSITTGWYLNPKVFFAIQNVITGSTPDTGFLLEYKLQKNLKLILRQGNSIQQGVDLKWNYDY